jgi:hypothetical protein
MAHNPATTRKTAAPFTGNRARTRSAPADPVPGFERALPRLILPS